MSDLPSVLDGTRKPSFCFTSITERWPKIVTKIIDQLHQYYQEAVKTFGETGGNDVSQVISKIAEIRYLIVTGKPLKDVAEAADAHVWNKQLECYRQQMGESNVTWFKTPWLFAECYLYRKIIEFFSLTTHLKQYDPFEIEKKRSYVDSMTHILAIGSELVDVTEKELSPSETRETLFRHLQIALWGNKCDLSLSGGDPHCLSNTIFQELIELRPNVLVDNFDELIDKHLLNSEPLKRIDIVLDNAGLEVFTDLCLADFLVSKSLVNKVVFHGKAIPWFVSDTTHKDFDWIINQLTNSEDGFLSKLGKRWTQFIADNKFEFKAHPFWTYGFAYFEMEEHSPDLYEELSHADIVIFKGDLNYRKLIGDRYWPLQTEFEKALRGFQPTKIFSLRTLKAETVAGLSDAAVKLIESKYGKEDLKWMVTGEYGIAQLFCPVSK